MHLLTRRQSARAKRLRLAVYRDGRAVLTSPQGIAQSVIEKFIADKKQWVLDKVEFFKKFKKTDYKPTRRFSRRDYIENKNKALTLAYERARFYNKTYGLPFNKIIIKNQKTRWGSCSRRGNINLNYKIVFLPERHRDYIIVHEMCHLIEFNHSRNFWAEVERTIPNHLELKRELRNPQVLYN